MSDDILAKLNGSADWARKMDRSHQQCRAVGHAWTEGLRNRYRLAPNVVGRILICERCAMERLDVYDRHTFELLNRRYQPPEGYAKPKDEEALDRRSFTAITLMQLKRERAQLPDHWEQRLSTHWAEVDA